MQPRAFGEAPHERVSVPPAPPLCARTLDRLPAGRFEIVTPRDPAQRGCQLSILAHHRPRDLLRALEAAGVMCDFREPNVIRVAPAPLYNTFHEVWTFAQILARC